MGQSTRTWAWVIIIGVALMLVSFLLFRNSASPAVNYDLNDPNIIGITQGTEGSFEELEIGVLFVEPGGAGVSIYSRVTDTWARNLSIDVGDPVEVSGYQIELVDTQISASTAFFRILPIE